VAKSCTGVCSNYFLRMAIFLNLDISQGSVATHWRCGGIFRYDLLQIYYWVCQWKKIWKSVSIWGSYGQEFIVSRFLTHSVETYGQFTPADPMRRNSFVASGRAVWISHYITRCLHIYSRLYNRLYNYALLVNHAKPTERRSIWATRTMWIAITSCRPPGCWNFTCSQLQFRHYRAATLLLN